MLDRTITHPLDQVLPHPSGRVSQRSSCGISLAAEDHSAEFIAQAVGRFRILLVAETLSQGKKLLLFSLLCVDPVLDQFQQYAILAQLSTLRHATYLVRQPGRQTHTLANRFLSHLHNTIMHQNGVRAIRGSSR
jgi:hypothetical protein